MTSNVHMTAPVPRAATRELAALSARDINFDPGELPAHREVSGWNVDRMRTRLGVESPGEPVADGVFAAAARVLERYEFADQRILRAAFYEDVPLEGRDMLLVGRFHGLRFLLGVRVGGVTRGPDRLDGRPVERFAWHYRTLEGHLEQGQMDYELVKWRDSGEVELRILARSRRAPMGNPIVALGFTVFARRQQLRFYDRALERTRTLVARDAETAPG
jgi:uncharacterized protein (UPF0548 family)